jgi:hypothetical protein
MDVALSSPVSPDGGTERSFLDEGSTSQRFELLVVSFLPRYDGEREMSLLRAREFEYYQGANYGPV